MKRGKAATPSRPLTVEEGAAAPGASIIRSHERLVAASSTSRFNEVRLDSGSHGELDRSSVDDTDDVSNSRGLDNSEERAEVSILSVELDDLLVVVRSLKELDTGVEGTAVGLEQDLDRVNRSSERVSSDRSSLKTLGVDDALGDGLEAVVHVGLDTGLHGELHLSGVADGDGVVVLGGVDNAAEGANVSVFDVDTHAVRGVVRSLPQVDVGVQGTSLGTKEDLDTADRRVLERPGAEGAASLDSDGLQGLPHAAAETGADTTEGRRARGDRRTRSWGAQASRRQFGLATVRERVERIGASNLLGSRGESGSRDSKEGKGSSSDLHGCCWLIRERFGGQRDGLMSRAYCVGSRWLSRSCGKACLRLNLRFAPTATNVSAE